MATDLTNNQVVAGASSQFVSIVPENGEQFSPRQKIIINVEPELGYIKKDSYLVLDVLNTSPNNLSVTFDPRAGVHSLFDSINIYSKETGVLLESLQNYSQWRAVEHQYLFDDKTDIQTKQGVGEPCKAFGYNIVGDANNAAVPKSQVLATAGKLENSRLSAVDVACNAKYATTRFMCPIKSGLLGAFDEEKLIPILNLGGLRIEIDLAENEKALVKVMGEIQIPAGADNSQLTSAVDLVSDVATSGYSIKGDNAGAAVIAQNTADLWLDAGGNNGFESAAATGLVVGNILRIYDHTGNVVAAAGELTIAAVEVDGAASVVNGKTVYQFVKVTMTGNISAQDIDTTANNFYIRIANAGQAVSYKLQKVEYRLLQITPPPNVMASLAKGINYEFTSYELFLDNVPTGALRHQVPINSVASKALAMFSVMFDTTGELAKNAKSHYSGLVPEDDKVKLNNIVYFINNRLYPLRSYNPQSKGDKVLTLNELNKAWNSIGKQPLCLGNNEFSDLNGYTNTFLIARELARNGFVFDLRNAEPEIRLQFSGTRADVLRINTFVFSKRVIQTSAQGVQVIY